MNLKVLGAGIFLGEELAQYPVPPAWRKATRNMMMAAASVQKALSPEPALQSWLSENSERVALIAGTCSGELETTAEFLSTLATTRVARPVLFQNSLHNATAGFATIHFKIRGPSFTLSNGATTPSEIVRLAEDLLGGGLADIAIVTLVEGHRRLAALAEYRDIIEGACTLILSTAAFAERQAKTGAPGLDLTLALKDYPEPEEPPFYRIDQSGVFELARALEGGK